MTGNKFTAIRVPPHDIEAEMCVIGSLLLAGSDQELIQATCAELTQQSFYNPDHGIYFTAMLKMHRDGKPLDNVLIKNELIRAGLFIEVGGIEYMVKLINTVPSPSHGPHYASVVAEKYKLREIIRISTAATLAAYEPARHDKATEIAGTLSKGIDGLIYNGNADNIITIGEAIEKVIDEYGTKATTRIKTGLSDLDEIIGGLPIGQFTLIGARPRIGKSALAKQIVLNAAIDGVRCGIITIEENRSKIGKNYLANASGVQNSKIVYGRANNEELQSILAAVPRLSSLPIFIADEPVKQTEVMSAVNVMVKKHKCKLIVVDYLQLIAPEEESNENRELTQISRALKNAWKHHDVAGLALCQLNRGSEAVGVRRPTIKDLRGSGAMDQDGDLIMLLHREDAYHYGEEGYNPSNQLEVIIAKNKDGGSGIVPTWFSGKYQAVTDWNGGLGTYHLRDGTDQGNIPFK